MDVVRKYVSSFTQGLHDEGVREVVICPGSRSTPLVLAFSIDDRFRKWIMYDERSAAFFALGIGKSTSIPSALVCTSGTAAANFLPAIMEAKLSRVPLIAITADRPPESRSFGSAQTTDQVKMYGSHAKFFQDMPIVGENDSALFRYAQLLGARVTHIASSAPAGPVQVNFPFREPLLPNERSREVDFDRPPQVLVTRVRTVPKKEDVEEIFREIKQESRGVIVVGPGKYELGPVRDGLSQLSKLLGWPILADPLSNLRNEIGPSGLVRCYEFLLRNKSFRESHEPEWVLHVGGPATSKELNSFCEKGKKILLEQAGGEWRDPTFSLSKMIYGEYEISLSLILEIMGNFHAPPDWQEAWTNADARACKITERVLEGIDQPFEGKLYNRLSKLLKLSSPLAIVVGNSMPVRDADAFFLDVDKNIELVGNKGANGIDGVMSTALGISAVRGNVLLILGDISFYHDMNGLLLAKLHDLRATIVIVNNDGGGIFSFLPQHSFLPKEQFERFFGAPHGLDFSGVKTIYGGEFYRVDNWESFDRILLESLESPGLKVIEFLAIDREANLAMHQSVFDEISSQI